MRTLFFCILFWGGFLTLSRYNCILMVTANDVTRLFHIIGGRRKTTQPLQSCAGPSFVWQRHMLPRDVSEVNSLVTEKQK